MAWTCAFAVPLCTRTSRHISDAAGEPDRFIEGSRDIEKIRWADFSSNSDYDANDFMPKTVAKLRRQAGDQLASTRVVKLRRQASDQLASNSDPAVPRRFRGRRRCLTWRNLLRELAYLLVEDVGSLTARLQNYVLVKHPRVFDARDKGCEITEDQVQVLVDELQMYFPHGFILQAPPDNSGEIEAVVYKPFEKPVYRIGKQLHPLPVVLTRGSGKAIIYCGWYANFVAKMKPWQQRTQEEFVHSVTHLSACQFLNKCRSLKKMKKKAAYIT